MSLLAVLTVQVLVNIFIGSIDGAGLSNIFTLKS